MTSLQPPSTSSGGGLYYSDFAYPGKRRHTPKFTGNIAEGIRPQPAQIEETFDNRSTAWDIELEDDILPSDSSSFAWGTTVVIDTENIWNHQKETKQSLQVAMDSCDQPQPLATRSPDEHSRFSPRVGSRFFSKCVSNLREDRSAPGTPTPDLEDHPDREPEVPKWDGFVHHHYIDVGWDCNSNQETDSFSDGYCRGHTPSLTSTYMRGFNSGGSNCSR